MDDFVAKPVDAERLYEVLDRVMAGRAVPTPLTPGEIGVRSGQAALDTLMRQLGAPAVTEIICSFRAELPSVLQALERTVGTGSVEDQQMLLYSLRSALINLGLVAAADRCDRQIAEPATGAAADTELVGELEGLISAGLVLCDTILAANAAEPPLASAA
jgi:hypothetical protein